MIKMKKMITNKLKVLAVISVAAVALFNPTTSEAAKCDFPSEKKLSSFTVKVPNKSEFGPMAGKKFTVYGENVIDKPFDKDTNGSFAGKEVKFEPLSGSSSITLDVNRVMRMNYATTTSAFDTTCYLKDGVAKKAGFKNTDAFIKEYENEISNISTAFEEELLYSDRAKKFVFEKVEDGDIDLKKLNLTEAEQKIINEKLDWFNDYTFNAAEKSAVKKLMVNYFEKEMASGGAYTKQIEDFNSAMKKKGKSSSNGREAIHFEVVDGNGVPYIKIIDKADYQLLLTVMKDYTYKEAKNNISAAREKAKTGSDEGTKSGDEAGHTAGKLITSPGMLTGGYFMGGAATCEEVAKEGERIRKEEDFGKDLQENVNSKDVSGMGGKEYSDGESSTSKTIKGALTDVSDGFVRAPEVAGGEGNEAADYNDDTMLGINCAEFGMMKFLERLYEPVNITSSKFLMDLIFTFQIVAIGLAVLLISVFGLYYATGNESTDPFKFLFKGFIILLVVYYFPFFMQDILNVNNMLVHFIAFEAATFDTFSSDAVVSASLLAFVVAINVILSGLAMAVTTGGTVIIVLILLLLFIIAFFVKAIVTLYAWWFLRFLMIMFLAVIGPLFIVMMLLPKTASYGHMWLKSFIGEVMTQSVIVIGFYFGANMLQNLPEINEQMNIGLVGNTILLYGLLLLLSKLPDVSRTLFGGALTGVVGYQDAKRMGESVGQFINNAGVAVASTIRNNARAKESEKDLKESTEIQEAMAEAKANGTELSTEFQARKERMDNKFEKQRGEREKKMQREAFAKSMQSGRMVDDGRYEKNLAKTARVEDGDKKIEEIKEAYKSDMEKFDTKKLGKIEADMKEKRDDAIQDADNTYAEEMSNINGMEEGEGKEAAKAEAEKKRDKSKRDANDKYTQGHMKAFKGHESAAKFAAAAKADAEGKMESKVRNALGKGDYVSEMEKALHAATIAGDIKSSVTGAQSEVEQERKAAEENLKEETSTNLDEAANGESGETKKLTQNEQEAFSNFINRDSSEKELGQAALKHHQKRSAGVKKIANKLKEGNSNLSENDAQVLAEDMYDSGTELTNLRGADALSSIDKDGNDASFNDKNMTVADMVEGGKNKQEFENSQKFTSALKDAGLAGNEEAMEEVRSIVNSGSADFKNYNEAKDSFANGTNGYKKGTEDAANRVESSAKIISSNPGVEKLFNSTKGAVGYASALNSNDFKGHVMENLENLGVSDVGQREAIANTFLNEARSEAHSKDVAVNEMFLRGEGMSSEEASVLSNEQVGSLDTEYAQGDKLGNAAPGAVRYDKSLGVLGNQTKLELGTQFKNAGVGGSVPYIPNKALESAVGETAARGMHENVTNATRKTIARGAVRNLDVNALAGLDGAVRSGEVYYDQSTNSLAGKAGSQIASVRKSLVQDAGYSEKDASYIANHIVQDAVSSGEVSQVMELPAEMKSMILTELHEGNHSRKDIIETIDIITGQDENSKEMIEDYIQQIEKEFDGNWDVIKGKTDTAKNIETE